MPDLESKGVDARRPALPPAASFGLGRAVLATFFDYDLSFRPIPPSAQALRVLSETTLGPIVRHGNPAPGVSLESATGSPVPICRADRWPGACAKKLDHGCYFDEDCVYQANCLRCLPNQVASYALCRMH